MVIPVLHEVVTCFQCLGDVVTLNPKKARERWQTYAEESMIGSTCYAIHEARKGNKERAKELLKGSGRATGQALLGGGLLKEVPVFHELATAGKSLGHVIGGGDTQSAEKEWDDYAHGSVVGSGVYAAHVARKGDTKKAKELGKAMAKATGKGVLTGAIVGTTVLTGGLAAPLGAIQAAAIGGGVGAVTGAGGSVATQAIDGKDIDAGDIIGAGLLGGTVGAITGGVAGKAVAKSCAKSAGIKASSSIANSGNALVASAAVDATETAVVTSTVSRVGAGSGVTVGAVNTSPRSTLNIGPQSTLNTSHRNNVPDFVSFKRIRQIFTVTCLILDLISFIENQCLWFSDNVTKPIRDFPLRENLRWITLYVLQPVICLFCLAIENVQCFFFQNLEKFRFLRNNIRMK